MTVLSALLKKHQYTFHPIVAFDPAQDRIKVLDLSIENTQLPQIQGSDDRAFHAYIEQELNGYKFGIGGYGEHRNIYAISPLFDAEEPRRFHLGLDIWGAVGTPVLAFQGGTVHSLAYNPGKGNYGATLIVAHQLEGLSFYVLYGHISLQDIEQLSPGQYLSRGTVLAHLGSPEENGGWPPHLHLQIIEDIGLYEGDYPGVCAYGERASWLANSPDPAPIAQLNQFFL